METRVKHAEFIFIDESGDLGLHGSKFFTIVALTTRDVASLSRIMKRLRERKLKKKMKELPEIKANNSDARIREFVLKKISALNCSISAVVIPKSKVRSDLFVEKDKLYNYLCGLLFEQISLNADVVDITIDKKHSNRLLREDFNQYIERRIKDRRSGIKVVIRHLESYASNALQAVDFVAWAVNRKFTFGESFYYDLIKPKLKNAGSEEVWR